MGLLNIIVDRAKCVPIRFPEFSFIGRLCVTAKIFASLLSQSHIIMIASHKVIWVHLALTGALSQNHSYHPQDKKCSQPKLQVFPKNITGYQQDL